MRFVGQRPSSATTSSFDLGFLRAQGLLTENIGLDTWELATILLPSLPGYSLGALAERFGLALPNAAPRRGRCARHGQALRAAVRRGGPAPARRADGDQPAGLRQRLAPGRGVRRGADGGGRGRGAARRAPAGAAGARQPAVRSLARGRAAGAARAPRPGGCDRAGRHAQARRRVQHGVPRLRVPPAAGGYAGGGRRRVQPGPSPDGRSRHRHRQVAGLSAARHRLRGQEQRTRRDQHQHDQPAGSAFPEGSARPAARPWARAGQDHALPRRAAEGTQQLPVPAALLRAQGAAQPQPRRAARDRPHPGLAAAHADRRPGRAVAAAAVRSLRLEPGVRRERRLLAGPLPARDGRPLLLLPGAQAGRGRARDRRQPRAADGRRRDREPRAARVPSPDHRRGAPPGGRGHRPAQLQGGRVHPGAALQRALPAGPGTGRPRRSQRRADRDGRPRQADIRDDRSAQAAGRRGCWPRS